MNRIKTLRKQYGVSQQDLAERLGVQRTMISKYENGHVPITNNAVVKLASFFNVSTDYLLGVSDEPGSPDESNIKGLAYDFGKSEEPILKYIKETASQTAAQIAAKMMQVGEYKQFDIPPDEEAERFLSELKDLFENRDLPQDIKDKLYQAFTQIYFDTKR